MFSPCFPLRRTSLPDGSQSGACLFDKLTARKFLDQLPVIGLGILEVLLIVIRFTEQENRLVQKSLLRIGGHQFLEPGNSGLKSAGSKIKSADLHLIHGQAGEAYFLSFLSQLMVFAVRVLLDHQVKPVERVLRSRLIARGHIHQPEITHGFEILCSGGQAAGRVQFEEPLVMDFGFFVLVVTVLHFAQKDLRNFPFLAVRKILQKLI